MNIIDEIGKGRLVVDFENPQVLIHQELYQELLDTSMFPHALRVIRMAWWKKCLLWLFSFFNNTGYEQMVMDVQFKFYLNKLLEFVNEERIHTLGMTPESVVDKVDFVITPDFDKAVYVGVYVEKADEYFIRPVFNDQELKGQGARSEGQVNG